MKKSARTENSICATTEGFSDGQWYYGPAEVDFWDVWHQLALDYNLNPDTTVMSGYSMGGFASYKLALEYPDLFAQSMPLEGPVVCGERVAGSVETAAGGEQCETDGNTTPLIVNAKWIPYVMTYGAADELVPFTGRRGTGPKRSASSATAPPVLYPAQDHLVFATRTIRARDTSSANLERVQNPGSFTFTWYPDLDSSSLGIGPTGDYWISGLKPRSSTPGELANGPARPLLRSDEPEQIVEHHTGVVNGPTPAVTDSLTWTPGLAPPTRQALTLNLTDVAALAVSTVSAKLKCATVTANMDGPTRSRCFSCARRAPSPTTGQRWRRCPRAVPRP